MLKPLGLDLRLFRQIGDTVVMIIGHAALAVAAMPGGHDSVCPGVEDDKIKHATFQAELQDR